MNRLKTLTLINCVKHTTFWYILFASHLDIINEPHESTEGLGPGMRSSNRIHWTLGQHKWIPLMRHTGRGKELAMFILTKDKPRHRFDFTSSFFQENLLTLRLLGELEPPPQLWTLASQMLNQAGGKWTQKSSQIPWWKVTVEFWLIKFPENPVLLGTEEKKRKEKSSWTK